MAEESLGGIVCIFSGKPHHRMIVWMLVKQVLFQLGVLLKVT